MAKTDPPGSGDAERLLGALERATSGYKTIGQMSYEVLREAILSGALPPGEWLRQESLAEAIGVSRIPVRTALLQLESEGLVTFQPHRGAQVSRLATSEINEIFRLRTVLESYALRMSMTRMTPARLSRLRELVADLDGRHDADTFLKTRAEFYRELYDSSNNPVLVRIIEDLRSRVGTYLLRVHVHDDHPEPHSALVKLVEDGDLTGAETWLASHLEDVRQRVEQSEIGQSPAPTPTRRGGARSTAKPAKSATKSGPAAP